MSPKGTRRAVPPVPKRRRKLLAKLIYIYIYICTITYIYIYIYTYYKITNNVFYMHIYIYTVAPKRSKQRRREQMHSDGSTGVSQFKVLQYISFVLL